MTELNKGDVMAKAKTSVALPTGTRRRGGVVLSTKSKAESVDRSMKRRDAMYALMAEHPESAEELIERVAQGRERAADSRDPLNLTGINPPSKKYEKPSALPRLHTATVSSPNVPLAVERVPRVLDTIEQMYKRKQLADAKNQDERIMHNERAYRVALKLRHAHDIVYGSVGGSMDFDRVRGAGSPGAPPPLHYREAADVLIAMKKLLYALDHRVLTLVVCEGQSIEYAAKAIYARDTSRAEREEIGRVLRQGLRELAEQWFEAASDPKRNTIVSSHAADARPGTVKYTTEVGVIQRGKTVTATRNRIHRN